MIDVIANAKAAFDVLGHARAGPMIGGESCRLRALEQLGINILDTPRMFC